LGLGGVFPRVADAVFGLVGRDRYLPGCRHDFLGRVRVHGDTFLRELVGYRGRQRDLSQLLSRWRYPVWLVLCLGWLVTLAPLAWFYTWLPEFFARYYPQLEPTVRGAEFSWSLSYLGQFLRGSLPWLLIWVCLVYGYRFVFGVDWFGSSSREFDEPVRTEAWPAKDHGGEPPVPEILRRSHLPLDVRIVALKAEEHYVRVWTNDGTELLRYRFRDAMKEMTEQPGLQVHRSWWVRLDGIDEVRNKGRGLELELSNGITVPVSLAHRSEFLQAFEKSPRRQRMVSDTISSPTSSSQPLSP
jgi:hypothetical protein